MKEKFKKFRNTRIFSFIVILLFIAVCIGAGAIFACVKHANDPTEEASAYLRAFIQQDYNTMYNYIDKDAAKMSKSDFEKKMRSVRQAYTIDSFEIGDVEKKNGSKTVTLTCKDEQDKSVKKYTIYMTKKGFINPKFLVDVNKTENDPQMIADSNRNELIIISDKVLNEYFIAVRNKDKKCKELLKLFKDDKNLQEKIRSYVKDGSKIIFKKNSKQFSVSEFETSDIKKDVKYNEKTKQFTVTYNFDYKFTTSTSTSLSNSYYSTKKGKRRAKMVLMIDWVNGKFVISDFTFVDKKK